ncbi:MAG: nucleoside triphosphate pyrophosphohydrolase [Thermotoga sp.]|nr:MAG: nucleoside triphosphate pyrophosphohydrolase [Thermotoga sp.]
MGKEGEVFEELVRIMEKLRSEDGCEWDRAQTHETLKPYVIEEAYEVAHAIDSGNKDELLEELGDLLLQIIFHSQIAKENGEFTIVDVIEKLSEKLVRRHPHVFGDAENYSYEQWERIKAQEKGKMERSRIGELNMALPALLLARRIQENASAVGFDWKNWRDVFKKVEEELFELKDAMEGGEMKSVEKEMGDLLFSVVNLSRFLNVDPEIALMNSIRRFYNRFRRMEEEIEKSGKVFEEMEIDELDKYWEKAKKYERGDSE